MKSALSITWKVFVWMVLVSVWNGVAILPVMIKARPAYATAWVVFLLIVLGIRYALPPGENLRTRLSAALLVPLPAQSKWILPLGIAATMLNASFAILGDVGDSSAETAITEYAARPMGFFPLVLFMVIFAPLFEELVMRGKILGLLRTPLGGHGAVVVSAALFALLHFGQSGGMLGRFALGIIAGETVLATGSLTYAIGIHAINNSLGVLAVWLSMFVPPSMAERAETPTAAGVIILGLVGALGVIETMRRLRQPSEPPTLQPQPAAQV